MFCWILKIYFPCTVNWREILHAFVTSGEVSKAEFSLTQTNSSLFLNKQYFCPIPDIDCAAEHKTEAAEPTQTGNWETQTTAEAEAGSHEKADSTAESRFNPSLL